MIASHKSMSNMEWEGAGAPEAPTAPESLHQAGLSLNFLNDLLMRTLYVQGVMLGLDLARNVCLPFKVIEDSLKQCAYIGPAPVPLEDYVEQTYRQAVTGISCSPEPLRAAFSHLVLKE